MNERPFGGYETAQDVIDAVKAGAVVKRELMEAALRDADVLWAYMSSCPRCWILGAVCPRCALRALGADYAIDFESPAALATLRDEGQR